MNKKGFTLIELIAALVLLTLVATLVAPAIINQVNEKREDISDQTLNLIYTEAELYFDDYNIATNLEKGQVYCVSLDELVKKGYLTKPIKDVTTGKEIPLTKYVKTTINSLEEYDNFELTSVNCNE